MSDVYAINQNLETRIRDTLLAHTPVDISGGSDDETNTIFCGGHQWHSDHIGWRSWAEHVTPRIIQALKDAQ